MKAVKAKCKIWTQTKPPSYNNVYFLQARLFKYDEKRYLSQFVSEMFDTLQ